MKINQDFGIALHILTYLSIDEDKFITSSKLAESVNTNPVIIRQILTKLAKENLVYTKRGRGGTKLNKKTNEISFLDVYNSLYQNNFFKTQHSPNKDCPIGVQMSNSVNEISKELTNDIKLSLQKYYISDIKLKTKEN